MQTGELLKLEVRDIDLHTNRITLRDTKNGTTHIIDIHPTLRDILGRRVQGKDPEERLFTFLSDDQLRDQFYKVRDLCGISNEYVWHTLRHSTGTWLSEAGQPLQVVAAVLNHKTIQTTARYAKTTDQARRAAINSI
jgi:integrase